MMMSLCFSVVQGPRVKLMNAISNIPSECLSLSVPPPPPPLLALLAYYLLNNNELLLCVCVCVCLCKAEYTSVCVLYDGHSYM